MPASPGCPGFAVPRLALIPHSCGARLPMHPPTPIPQGLALGLLTTLLASAACREDAAPPSDPSVPDAAAASAAGANTAAALTFTAITTGGNHTCGVDPNGAVWCWGENLSGQLGDGTST